ncbi:universal stress protein [Tropicimonas sp. S265A]|uniref:universal stress protein n=1 Tax=Tropicimonas sp. S265A TaxID=3415134 RepID=UPI003C7C5A9F
MYSRILVPIDLANTPKLTRALEAAARLARDHDAKVIYLNVVDTAPSMPGESEGQRTRDAMDVFAAEQANLHGIETADHVALRGDLHLHVGKEIIAAATQSKCDLIVMASHMPGLMDHVFSSNAGYVATHAPVSVFVVR